jgi:predicted nucleotidyltransferase component of viral defense system
MKTLYYNTINELLKNSLLIVMSTPIFDSFRLVGGTALSLRIGHRESIDIDLFSDINYGEIDSIRLASIEEIIAMKMDVIQRGGRKKDFWDLHELLSNYSIHQMIALHERRYPYSHDKDVLLKNLINFDFADNDLNPICLKGKYWEFIKDDFQEIISEINLT